MKIMDEVIQVDDSPVATPPQKKKKLVQALLSFTTSSPGSPTALTNKKRKNVALSPLECRSPKIVKIMGKENTEGKTISVNAKKDSCQEASGGVSAEKVQEDRDEISVVLEISSETAKKNCTDDRSAGKDGRTDEALRILEKTKKNAPIVMLRRCDSTDVLREDEKMETSCDKGEERRGDESSGEELANWLDDSEDENSAKEKSSDAAAASDSDSAQDLSSSDEGNDKRTKEEKDEASIGTNLEKTPSLKGDGASAARRRLTPKQLEKRMETTKRREERRLEKMEREKQREQDRLKRHEEREAQRRKKMEKTEAEKEQKRKEKEQKELKKQMEIEQKQKEKERRDRAKEDDRKKREEAKEEEKRKKEEERLESERKKQKAASTFVSFFVPKKSEGKAPEKKRPSNFMPFQVKADMRVAPLYRRSLKDSDKTSFDTVCIDKWETTENLWITEIKNREIGKSAQTWPPEAKDVTIIEEDDVGSCNMVDQSEAMPEKQRPKLLAFFENRRPPYWGTWRKRSNGITPRRPFFKDTLILWDAILYAVEKKIFKTTRVHLFITFSFINKMKWFDYEVDSDEEWEEEEPGESLRGSDDEKDEEKDEENPDDNEYDVDNEFMVPHGYLSDEEGQADDDEEDMSPETQKFKLKILGEEFEAERKTQTLKVTPKVIGCIWQGALNAYSQSLPEKLVNLLMSHQAWVRETPIALGAPPTGENVTGENSVANGEERRGARKTRVPDEALPELIRLIHGNTHGCGFLVKEFMTFWNRKKQENAGLLSKSSLIEKIREFGRRIACPDEGPMHLKACWYVSEQIRKEYLGEEVLELPNTWTYALTPKRRQILPGVREARAKALPEKPAKPSVGEKNLEKEEKEKEKKASLITQYTKKISQEEMKKQLTLRKEQISSPKASTSQAKTPKRVQLISVPRAQQFPKSPIANAFALASGRKNEKNSGTSEKTKIPEEIEIVELVDDSNDG